MRRVLSCLALLLAAAGLHPGAAPADFADGPALANTLANGTKDLGDLYVFRSPTNANNTVFVLTAQPFPGNLTPTAFRVGARYDVKIDRTADYRADLTLRATFGPADGTGSQPYVLRCLPRALCANRGLLARGRTGQNLPTYGGGLTRAGIQDNPAFFDRGAWDDLAADGVGTFPRLAGAARNYYGPNGNVLAVVIEIPSRRVAANSALIATWTRLHAGGVQVDREGRPFTPIALLPNLPRNAATPDRRDAFNAEIPSRDDALFKADVVSTLDNWWGRTPADANAVANLWMPDTLIFQVGNPNGFGTFVADPTGPFAGTRFGNGRRLRDDAYDISLNILSNGSLTSENVPDDNGTRVTDGNAGSIAAFPYIGAANLPLNGPGTGPNP